MEAEYQVKTEVFEGPLELLLNLVEKRKLFINDISLSQVADDYITHTGNLEKFSINESVNFILVASTLILIKSKSLLPNLSLTEEEKEDINDLEKRLKDYQKIKELSYHIKNKFGSKIIFQKTPNKKINIIFSPSKDLKKENLLISINNLITNLPNKETLPQKTVTKIISLEEVINNLANRIKSSLSLTFNEFYNKNFSPQDLKEKKVSIIVSFLAMLELVKQGILVVKQDKRFDDISMETLETNVPHYH